MEDLPPTPPLPSACPLLPLGQLPDVAALPAPPLHPPLLRGASDGALHHHVSMVLMFTVSQLDLVDLNFELTREVTSDPHLKSTHLVSNQVARRLARRLAQRVDQRVAQWVAAVVV